MNIKIKIWKQLAFLIKHECANYVNGNCLKLEEPCVQLNSRYLFEDKGLLICKYFANSVLPIDKPLQDLVNDLANIKKCFICNTPIVVGSNRKKYCNRCAAVAKKKQNAASARKKRVQRRKIEA